jgi:hypothetical protein
MHAGFWCENVKERDLLEDLDVDGIHFTMGVKELGRKALDVINVAQGGEGTSGGL